MQNGYLRVAAVAPKLNVADVTYNVEQIIQAINELESKGVEIAVFPEMCITGYTCADLFHNMALIEAASKGLEKIATHTADLNIDVIVGLPMVVNGVMYNCAALVKSDGIEYIKKTYIPNYNEFYERRWWAPADEENTKVMESHGAKIGIEICEDLWAPIPPSCRQSLSGAEVIFNLSASNDLIGKHAYLLSLIRQQSARCHAGYVYASSGYGESTTDLVFFGKAIIAESGTLLIENCRTNPNDIYAIADVDIEAINRDRLHSSTFSECVHRELKEVSPLTSSAPDPYDPNYIPEYRKVNPTPFVPANDKDINERCREIIAIQTAGLARRLQVIHAKTLVCGISGGLDSTLALLVAVNTFKQLGLDLKGIIGVTMPGFGTTDRTYTNALRMMESLGITIREIPIGPAVTLHFSDIGHNPEVKDVTYENSQARERTQILMDIANQVNGIVLGTGDLSELALGWATYNGDHMSMYGINAGIPKTLVRYLVRWFAEMSDDTTVKETLLDVIDTPISPELTPADENGEIAQKTEQLIGPYELTDFFLYYTLRYGFSPRRIYTLARQAFAETYDNATLLGWLLKFYRRFFSQQFKRSCLPDGPKVGSVCLSPRGDWRMPSDASSAVWIKETEQLIAEL